MTGLVELLKHCSGMVVMHGNDPRVARYIPLVGGVLLPEIIIIRTMTATERQIPIVTTVLMPLPAFLAWLLEVWRTVSI